MYSLLGVSAQSGNGALEEVSRAAVLSALSFYPKLVSESINILNCFLESLKRVQDKKDAAAITHATHNTQHTTDNPNEAILS